MYKRYRERRRRRYGSEYRGRSIWTRPSAQITIVLAAVLIIYIILTTAGR
jgi:hypothetical protein